MIVCVLSAYLRDEESSTCVCLRLREQCLRSEITSVARVATVLLLRFVAGNVDVNTPASKRSQLIGNTAIVRKRCVIHKSRPVCASVFQLPRLRGNAGTQGSTCGRLKSSVAQTIVIGNRGLDCLSIRTHVIGYICDCQIKYS